MRYFFWPFLFLWLAGGCLAAPTAPQDRIPTPIDTPFDPATDCKIPYKSQERAALCIAGRSAANTAASIEVARIAAIISGIAACAAITFAYFNLRTAQRAKEANRAWVMPVKFNGTFQRDAYFDNETKTWQPRFKVAITFKNFGKSPALQIKGQLWKLVASKGFFWSKGHITSKGRFELSWERTIPVGVPENEIAETFIIYGYENLSPVLDGGDNLLYMLKLEYRDVLSSTTRRHESMISIIRIGDSDDFSITERDPKIS